MINDAGKLLNYGEWDCKPPRGHQEHMRPWIFFVNFQKRMAKCVAQANHIVVGYETLKGFAGGHTYGVGVGNELRGVLKLAYVHSYRTYYERVEGMELHDLTPSALKKHMTGKGNCNKKMMVAAASGKYGLPSSITDNEADAIAVADYLLTCSKRNQS
jgi:hypothetical protein